VYKITDSKKYKEKYKINPLQHPQTIIDIGILRIYKSPKINYVRKDVKYSTGSPKFMQTENSPLLFAASSTNGLKI